MADRSVGAFVVAWHSVVIDFLQTVIYASSVESSLRGFGFSDIAWEANPPPLAS